MLPRERQCSRATKWQESVLMDVTVKRGTVIWKHVWNNKWGQKTNRGMLFTTRKVYDRIERKINRVSKLSDRL
jgi:hypothetical protein